MAEKFGNRAAQVEIIRSLNALKIATPTPGGSVTHLEMTTVLEKEAASLLEASPPDYQKCKTFSPQSARQFCTSHGCAV